MSETQQRLNEAFQVHEDLIAGIFQKIDAEQEHEGGDAEVALDELAEDIDKKVLVTITLGGRGPSYWIEVTCEAESGTNFSMQSAEFHTAWSGNTERVEELTEEHAMYRYAEQIIEGMN